MKFYDFKTKYTDVFVKKMYAFAMQKILIYLFSTKNGVF